MANTGWRNDGTAALHDGKYRLQYKLRNLAGMLPVEFHDDNEESAQRCADDIEQRVPGATIYIVRYGKFVPRRKAAQ